MRFAVAAAAVMLIACGRTPSPEIAVVGTPHPTAVEVRGLSARDIDALAALSKDQWTQIFGVAVVPGDARPMAGEYVARDGVVRFTPMYGFDKGRTFHAVFDPARVPGATGQSWEGRGPLQRTFGVPADVPVHSTSVRTVYPSGGTLPENMLRFYIEFSAPMGRGPAIEHVHLLDDAGKEITEPFLPVEADLWNPDRTRFTLFFDPGRVKRGIKPNRDMGRALVAGTRYTLVIDKEWRDGQGQPLTQQHRHEFVAGPAIERGLDTAAWKVTAPKAGTREPLVVTFPWPLDAGLLQRALNVERRGAWVAGDVRIENAEARWTFTPREPWTVGDYSLVVLTLLEDPAGNRIGRAFEVTRAVDEKARVEISFSVK